MITTNSNYSFYTKRSSRRFLIATISKQLGDSFNLGPSEMNWEQTPFICGTDICRDFREYFTLDMRRLKSLDENCLYEELHSVEAEDSDFDYDEANGDYMDEEESRKLLGYIFVAYECGQEDQFCEKDYDFDGFIQPQKFAIDWRKWSGIRELCETLPPQCTFKRMIFYREISETSSYKHVLLIEVNKILAHQSMARNSVNNIRSQTNVYIGLYAEVEFEMDLEALQTLVVVSETVKCVGCSLVVLFRPIPRESKDLSVSHFSRICHYEVDLINQPSPTRLKVPNQVDFNRNYTAHMTRTPTTKGMTSKKLSVFSNKKLSAVSNNNGSYLGIEKANSWNIIKSMFNRQAEEDELNNNPGGSSNNPQNRQKPVSKVGRREGMHKFRKLFKNPFSRFLPDTDDSFNNNTQEKDCTITNKQSDVHSYGTFGDERPANKARVIMIRRVEEKKRQHGNGDF